MAPVRDRLEELAQLVASGREVDWESVLSQAMDADERRAIEQLRAVDGIAHGGGTAVGEATRTQTEVVKATTFTPGQTLGGRYRIQALLGRGGMGEVWQAFDLKLRVDVALKSILRDQLASRHILERLRQEVRSAREVVSPNVCRIYDLEEIDGQELISMEFIDGTTLFEVLRERGPLDLREATEIASQFLLGLDAIHQAGLVHRDVKPENVMITRAGRVVLMDFGLAKPETDESGTVAGTPAYMAPEQVRGDRLDARADIFATGVVLAEMISADGIRERESRESIHRGVHQDPPQLPDTPWHPVLRRAVAADPQRRYASARELIRALEEITTRTEGAEDVRPYPGLASFTEEDAAYFFGREAEVEEVWKKLRRPHLLALVGPSGAGKTSFLQAGLLAAMPQGWLAVRCKPGSRPFKTLAQALASDLAGDAEAMRLLVDAEDPDHAVALVSRWRVRREHALIVVDQFEELFTLNPPEVQQGFAELLGRLALEADVHVLLSLRDDFLLHCSEHRALAPIFSELTPLRPLSGSDLRRALVQPALKCGYRFEDEALVDDTLAEVTHERGALPLMAFAVAQLWERRDREGGLLTRDAYEQSGGVGGALAKHADATLERIGSERLPIVREIFRNLVTAQGTRVVRETDELLSVFEERGPAREVLRELIDARLLTSFEFTRDEGEEGQTAHRVEIIHESLIAKWPRLERWRTQDSEGAQLRDQLRQAASLWEERHRPDDLLWSGSSYKEYELWRERYPGGLTSAEEAFASAMTSNATKSRRRRRAAVAGAFALLLVVSGVLGWSVTEQRQARLVAEANNLLTMGRGRLLDHPSEALAYAIASLETADSIEARRFAQNVLWRGPTAFTEEVGTDNLRLYFSADGQWLFASGWSKIPKLWRQDGSPVRVLEEQFAEPVPFPYLPPFQFSGDGTSFVTWEMLKGPPIVQRDFRVWSLPEMKFLRRLEIEPVMVPPWTFFVTAGASDLIEVPWRQRPLRRWSLTGGAPDVLDPLPDGVHGFDIDPSGRWLTYHINQRPAGPGGPERSEVYLISLDDGGATTPRQLVILEGSVISGIWVHPDSRQIATRVGRRAASEERSDLPVWQRAGIRFWPLDSEAPASPRTFEKAGVSNDQLGLDRAGRWIAAAQWTLGTAHIWDRSAPAGTEPLVLRRGKTQGAWGLAMHPEGTWVAVADQELSLWPLGRSYPHVLHHAGRTPGNNRSAADQVWEVVVDPGGKWVATSAGDNAIWLWPLVPTAGHEPRLLTDEWGGRGLEVSPDGRYLLTFRDDQGIVLSVADGTVRKLDDFAAIATGDVESLAFDPSGSLVVGGGRVCDLHSGELRIFSEEFSFRSEFLADGRLLVLGDPWEQPVLRLWDLDAEVSEIVYDGSIPGATPTLPAGLKPNGPARILSPDGRHLLLPARGDDDLFVYKVFDLERGEPLRQLVGRLPMSTGYVYHPVWHPSGRYVLAATLDGPIEIVPLDGSASYLLYGHDGIVTELTAHPEGKWIASGALDGTARIWPMPEGVPLQARPHDELLERLRALTNYRVEKDQDSPTGYRVTFDRLPAWKDVPTW